MSAAYGAAFGPLPIGWLVLNIIFLYQLTNDKGEFEVLQRSISGISDDRRLQLLFIAFSLRTFLEGAAGFGTPLAVTAAMLIRALLLPACHFGPVAHRKHRACSLRRPWHPRDRARGRHWARP
jgi:L-lactate permease